MNTFVTKLSSHCYYGNITNILNYYGEDISEAELVLLSDALNCDVKYNENLFFGISNDNCKTGLQRIGYEISSKNNGNRLPGQHYPILLLIDSGVLTHNPIFKGTNKKHYIVLINKINNEFEISDSFIQTIPMSVFQGLTEVLPIQNEISKNNATDVYLQKVNSPNELPRFNALLKNYIEKNATNEKDSIIYQANEYCKLALSKIDNFFNSESLKNLSYDIKVAGAVARFDYLIELLSKYMDSQKEYLDTLRLLKSKWELISSKLMKYSMTLKRDNYIRIYESDIPLLIEKEQYFYQNLLKSEGCK